MLKKSLMHQYQGRGTDFIKDQKKCLLLLDMGLGKTVTTLTAVADLYAEFAVDRILVVAPLRVANTVWHKEILNWEHLKHLSYAICTGTPAQRKRALSSNAIVTIINRENIPWLIKNHKWQWDMVVIDECSSFKSHKSQRFKELRKQLKHVKYLVGLTGTPTPNGMMDLWSQMFLVDNGQRLGRTITNYRMRFFTPDGYQGYSYKLNKGADKLIMALIEDKCLSMSAEDYLELPDKINVTTRVSLPDQVMAKYKSLEKEFVLELENTHIEAPSAAALANKLLQYSNGAVYDENKTWHELHDEKIKRLQEIVEDNPGENILVAYNFKSDLERITKAFPKAVVLSKSGKELEAWNKGKIKMLVTHPASAGHGLNAQYGGNTIVWFGLSWSLELYQQFNARLHRQGQTKPVKIFHLVSESCIDERVMLAISNKATSQQELLDYLKAV